MVKTAFNGKEIPSTVNLFATKEEQVVKISSALWRFLECPLCQSPASQSGLLCTTCEASLPKPTHSCSRCAHPLPFSTHGCGHCFHLSGIDRVSAPFIYQDGIKELVLRYKQANGAGMARPITQLLWQHMQYPQPAADALIAVPYHLKNLRKRGFDPAHELTKHLSIISGIPQLHRGVFWSISHREQKHMSKTDRRRLRAGHFMVKQPMPRRVIIVDDIVTTGQTCNALACALKTHGAESVSVWAIARTPLKV